MVVLSLFLLVPTEVTSRITNLERRTKATSTLNATATLSQVLVNSQLSKDFSTDFTDNFSSQVWSGITKLRYLHKSKLRTV